MSITSLFCILYYNAAHLIVYVELRAVSSEQRICTAKKLRGLYNHLVYKEVGTRPAGRCDMRPSTIITDYKTNHFRWYVLDNICRTGCWSFWSWFDVSQSMFDENMRLKRFLYFRSQWPYHLTIRPQICSPSYSCPALDLIWFDYVLSKLEVYGFPASR